MPKPRVYTVTHEQLLEIGSLINRVNEITQALDGVEESIAKICGDIVGTMGDAESDAFWEEFSLAKAARA